MTAIEPPAGTGGRTLFRGAFLVKDLMVEIAGTSLTEGSRWLVGTVSGHDQELALRYRRAGLVILGKTNTCEFGLSPTVEPALFGPARNPWDQGRSTGGSSGGTAAVPDRGRRAAGQAADRGLDPAARRPARRPGLGGRCHRGGHCARGMGHIGKYLMFDGELANVTGNPAATIPFGTDAAGLPIGIHALGRYDDEATLLRLAAQLEMARPWAPRHPRAEVPATA